MSRRFRFPKIVLFSITGLHVVLMIVSYWLYNKEPFVDCAHRMLLSQILALGFQVVLNYVNFRSQNKIVILATLFISSVLFSGVLSSFFNFQMMCRFLGY